MRLGVTIRREEDVVAAAVAAENVGVPFVMVVSTPGIESVRTAEAAVATTSIRIAVVVRVGEEHPTTIAEEMAVLDNLSNGRLVVVADVAELDVDAAVEDVAVLRAALSGRPIAHRGQRWQVPSNRQVAGPPHAVMVTPAPAQLSLPLWLAGLQAAAAGAELGLPVVVDDAAAISFDAPVAPGRVELAGSLDEAREQTIAWAGAGATHLACGLNGTLAVAELARWLIPEVGMVGFPRVVAEAPLPAAWPAGRRHDPVAHQ